MAAPIDERPATRRGGWLAYPYLIAALAAGAAAGALQLAGWTLASQGTLIALTVVMAVRSGIRMLRQLRSGAFGVDLLAVIAIIATILVGEYWASWVIVLMLSTGEALEDYAGRRAQHDLDALIDRTPRIAHAVGEDGALRDVLVSEVRVGDRLAVGPGELVPVDGELVDAVAALDESSVTGESLPVEKGAGDELLSGTVNGATAITMVAVRAAADSQYQTIVRIVEEAARSRPPLVRLADRYAVPFTVFALALAAAAWWLSGDPVRFAEVLVVATPCPLLVAAPVAFIAGMSRAAREGIIVKTGGAFEVLVRARTFVFDKTGTLTRGRPALVELRAEPGAPPELLRIAAEAEQLSPHVLARATVRAALDARIPLRSAVEVEETPARGVRASVGGRAIRIGRRSFVEEGIGAALAPAVLKAGEMAAYVAVDGRYAGALIFRDEVRPESARLVRALREHGARTIAMVTGDDAQTARHVADLVGLDDVRSGCLPADKVEIVRALPDRPVVMVGDGVNDAPVLAAAEVGIAMGAAGATAASESAEVVLLVDDLSRVGRALRVAKDTLRVALQSIWLGMGLSAALMVIAAFGLLPALVGALLQEVVDVLSILSALRALGARRSSGARGPGSPELGSRGTFVPAPPRARP
ncbi:heavy metal translocating P-type ATPase [Microbacterium insulae]|uniref:Heavy metal translocating P-type ATPase n=1 Tax=Microbacterium insulae TaxID=483014 RepID=A0ABW3AFA9_9MICO